jgi:hypothetical protein
MLTRDVTVLNASAHLLAASTVQAMICYVCWIMMCHPPYSLFLSLCDLHVFIPNKKALKGCRFRVEEDVKAVVVQW